MPRPLNTAASLDNGVRLDLLADIAPTDRSGREPGLSGATG